MTSIAQPPVAGDPRPPEKRLTGTSGGALDQHVAGLQTTYLQPVPPPRAGSDGAEPDATARELRELRREMALLRSDYARLRQLLSSEPGTGAADPGVSPPTAAMVVVDRTSLEATRPVVRPRPRSSPGPGPRPAPTRRPVAEPASAPRPDVALPSRPGVPATDRTTALPVTRAPAPDQTTALPITTPRPTPRPPTPVTRTPVPRPNPAPTTAPPVVPAPDRTTALPVTPTDRTTALPVTPAPDQTTALPVTPRPTPRPPAPSTPATRTPATCTPTSATPASRRPDPAGGPGRPGTPSPAPVPGPRPGTATTTRLPSVRRPAPVPVATPAGASGPTEALAAVLAEVLERDDVPVDSHFFDDLGADSMLMARFCARLRKQPELPTVSIKDVYRHTTISALAGAFGGTATAAAPEDAAAAVAAGPALPDPAAAPMSRSKPRFFLCGLLQMLWMLAFPLLMTFVTANGFVWVAAGQTVADIYLRALTFSGGAFAATCAIPILLKWTLVGRWKPRQLRVWSPAYLRFWLVKSLIQINPLARYAGSPIFSVYLRLLGAKIGRGVLIFSPTVPVCTDLFTVGAGSVIRKDAVITGYRAVDGVIQIGPVSLGRDVYVGEMTVLDIATSMGDGSQLGHSSSLHSGQAVPAGARWHGSPAEPSTVDYRTVRHTRLSFPRRFLLPLFQLLFTVGVTVPVALGLPILVFRQVPQLTALVAPLPPAIGTWVFYRDALLVSTVLFAGFLLLGMLLMVTVPRLLRVLVRPDREYRLYGLRYWAHGRIGRMTNNRFFVQLLGDSSYIVRYLRGIGYDLSKVVQTGSNFGSAVQHDNPFLSTVGTGTVVADGLSFINADYSGSHFRVSRVAIGAHNFLGNRVAYPAQGRTGDDCLLATKVMVPMDGPVRQGVGLLGSPSFEIPRTVDRDHQLDVADPAEVRRLLRRKNRHNFLTILLFLLSRWVLTSAITVLTLVAVDLHSEFGLLVALAGVVILPMTTGYLILLDFLVRRMMVHRPNGCSIYDRAFWRHERFWKLGADRFPQLFNGTPFKNVVWRMLGAKIGKRVFDDGCTFTERRFVSIGDHCTLNAGSIVQCHSQEDGAFKSERSAVGARATLGVGAFVHYGVQMGPRVLLEADSFLMKGSDVPGGSRWGGNPAMELAPAEPARPVRSPLDTTQGPQNDPARCPGGQPVAPFTRCV